MQRLFVILALGFSLAAGGLAHGGYLKQAGAVFAETNPQADTAFFSGVHLGMSIDDALKSCHLLGNVAALWHSDAPTGQERMEFRTDTSPQRRIYVHYLQADNKIVSVSYAKIGEGETFTKAERNHLVKLNGDPKELKVTSSDDGSEFELTTPKQFRIEAANP